MPTTNLIDISTIVGMLSDRITVLAPAIFPHGRREGHEFRVGSLAGEPGRSLAIHLAGDRAGVWADFASGERGDALDLVAKAFYNGNKSEALTWSRSWLGLGGSASEPTRPKPPPLKEPSQEELGEGAMRLWLGCKEKLNGTPAERYLASRGICLGDLGRQPRALRFHPELWNKESGRKWPAIVAAICNPIGQHVAVHRTWLLEDGSAKAPLIDAKMTLGRYAGGCIRLWRGSSGKSWADAPEGETVVVAEGIEDGLSIAIARPEHRVLAGVSLSNMGGMKVPPNSGKVLLCCDNDVDPQALAGRDRAITNFMQQGKRVALVKSPIGKDMNDLLRAPGQREEGAA